MGYSKTFGSGSLVLSCAAAAMLLSASGQAMACGQPPVPPPGTWQVLTGPGALTVYVELGTIFATQSPHACSCGLGLGSLDNLLPFGVDINSVELGIITRTDGEVLGFDKIPQFDALLSNPAATAGWEQGPPIPFPGIGSPNPGAQWFGFGGLVDPVEPGTPFEGQFFAIAFELKFQPGTLAGQTFDLQIGVGLGGDDFGPLFMPGNDHSARYSEVVEITFIPTPGTAGVMALSALCLVRRRRG